METVTEWFYVDLQSFLYHTSLLRTNGLIGK